MSRAVELVRSLGNCQQPVPTSCPRGGKHLSLSTGVCQYLQPCCQVFLTWVVNFSTAGMAAVVKKKILHFNVCSIHEGQKIPTKLVDVLSALRAAEAQWVGEVIYWKTGREETTCRYAPLRISPPGQVGCPGQPHQRWTRELGAGV